MKPHFPLILPLALAACQTPPPDTSAAVTPQDRGRALAQSSCAQCHAVGAHGLSPEPDAPPFASIVNQEGLTAGTLSTWLRDAHNYPRDMQFELGPRQVDDLVAHMLTLRDPEHRPPI